jgi:hypothetical protein
MALASGTRRVTVQRPSVTAAERKTDKALPTLLRRSVLAYLFLPPIVVFFLGLVLSESSFVTTSTAQLLIACSTVWAMLALLVVSIALIVSGVK